MTARVEKSWGLDGVEWFISVGMASEMTKGYNSILAVRNKVAHVEKNIVLAIFAVRIDLDMPS